MPAVAAVAAAPREAIDLDLLGLAVSHDLGGHLRPLHHRLPRVHLLAVAREQDLVERHLAPGLGREQRDLDGDPGLGAELRATGGENGVGHWARKLKRGIRIVKLWRLVEVLEVVEDGAQPPPTSTTSTGLHNLLQATAYRSVPSRPAGFALIRNSSSRIMGSSRTSSSKPVCFSSWRRKLGSCSTRYSATSGCSRTDSWRSLRSEEHTSELQSPCNLVCRLLLEKKK